MAKAKIGIAVDEELHAIVKSAAPLRGLNLEGAYDQALRTWVDQRPVSKYDPANESLHEKLEQIIKSGDAVAIGAVCGTVDLAFARLKPEKSGRRADAVPENAE